MTTIRFKKFDIEAYKPGKSTIKRLKNIIKLSANESALGMSAKVRKVVSNKNLNFSRYPDGKSKILRIQISKKFKCDKERIICGAGSDEVIQMLCQLFLKPKDEVIVPQFSFLMYRIYAKVVGANVIFAKEKKFKISIQEVIKKVSKKTKIVFLANPNNPTGTYLTKVELLELRRRLRKNILLVVDDAYAEYMKNADYKSGLTLFKNKKNVLKNLQIVQKKIKTKLKKIILLKQIHSNKFHFIDKNLKLKNYNFEGYKFFNKSAASLKRLYSINC